MAIVAHGAALLEADGLVTEKSAGWRFGTIHNERGI